MSKPIVQSITDEQLAEIEALSVYLLEYGCSQQVLELGQVRSLITRLRAAEKDAARWRHARRILPVETIEQCQADFNNYGMVGCEHENERADQAIDTAMEQQP